MYNQENQSWINQTIYQFKDGRYGSDGFLRLSLTTTTTDYTSFNAPFLMLSVSNKLKKNYRIDYNHSIDLIGAFKKIFSQSNGDQSEMRRRATKNVDLIIKFYVDQHINERLVRIELLSNETDYTKVIMEANDFYTIAQCIKGFSENYFTICKDLFVKSIDSSVLREIPEAVRTIPSYVLSNTTPLNCPPASEEVVEEAKKTEASIEDLDKFIGGSNMDNVFIPEIDVKKDEKVIEHVESPFVDKVLHNDLSNLEKLLTGVSMSKCPQLGIEADILSRLNYPDEDFRLFAGASEKDIKSIVYCSQVIYAEKVYNYLMFEKPISQSMPVFKYTPDQSKVKQENVDLALDLLTFGMYIKCVRGRMSGKQTDGQMNKSLFHTQMRAFLDTFVYSFLSNVEPDVILGMVSRRYNSFDNLGVFQQYKELLTMSNCPPIDKSDVVSALSELTEKGIFQAADVSVLHDVSVERANYKLTSESSYTLEQIIEEFIPLEVASQLGRDLNDKDVIEDLKNKYNLSDNILKLYIEPKKARKVPERKTTNNILRICKYYDDEVPTEFKEEFYKSLENFSDKVFDFENSAFSLDEFGENIIKALYIWNPEKNKNYKEFFSSVEQEVMEKDLILAKFKMTPPVESSDWDFTVENLE
ncbi:MAG: hypothetical protein ACTSWJ_05540 [Candidatus Heimdallarchaeaceae archaeon]